MQPLVPAVSLPGQAERILADYIDQWRKGNATLRKAAADAGVVTGDEEGAKAFFTETIRHAADCERWINDTYTVSAYSEDNGPGVHLSIKRNDRAPIHDWRDLQEIKNQLVGPECEAVELYPAESRLVDSANQYHLWCVKDTKFRFPLGFNTRLVGDDSAGGSVNRKL